MALDNLVLMEERSYFWIVIYNRIFRLSSTKSKIMDLGFLIPQNVLILQVEVAYQRAKTLSSNCIKVTPVATTRFFTILRINCVLELLIFLHNRLFRHNQIKAHFISLLKQIQPRKWSYNLLVKVQIY